MNDNRRTENRKIEMESVQARVQEAITNLMTKLDREHLRKIQVLRSTYSYAMWRCYARLALLSSFYDPEHSDHLILSPGDGVIDIGVDITFCSYVSLTCFAQYSFYYRTNAMFL